MALKSRDIDDIPIATKENAIENIEKFFTLINNISSYPDKEVKTKYYNNPTSEELLKFANDLGFNSINELNIEMITLAKKIQSAKQQFPEIFENNSPEFKKIATGTFANDKFKKHYKTTFSVKSPYKTDEEELSKKKNKNPINTSDGNIDPPALSLADCCCCPCTEEYNNSMSAAFWTASVGAAGCVGLFFSGVATGASAICASSVASLYAIAKTTIMNSWEICTSGYAY